ncbi:hypothetical protein AB0J72_17050 [Dactylosporangium sp. NPDC049742]|uniref:hypothetical protein n=1 Tax=Dactylosporangium sp. NPDC049742 TaxID=3154737 RepID=UPI0034340E39
MANLPAAHVSMRQSRCSSAESQHRPPALTSRYPADEPSGEASGLPPEVTGDHGGTVIKSISGRRMFTADRTGNALRMNVFESIAGTASRKRGGRILHPSGRTFTGELQVYGSAGWNSGAALLDRPGRHRATVRPSKGAGQGPVTAAPPKNWLVSA